MSVYSRFYEAPYSSLRTSIKPHVYPQDIECIVDPSGSNSGGIYISNLEAAQNPRTLGRFSIKAVLTAANGAYLNHSRSEVPFYKFIPAEDHQSYDLSRHFEDGVRFIEQHVAKTNVLIHCMAGISRSVTLVIAYLIKCRNMDYQSAFSMVKRRRKIIHPNDGFIKQLKEYQSAVRGRQVSQSPEKRHEFSITHRYQTPQHTRREVSSAYGSPSPLRQSSINYRDSKAHSFTQLKKSTITKDYNYNNEEELDQKIAQIRKKYSQLSGTGPTSASNSRYYQNQTIQFPQSNTSYRRGRYAHSYFDKDERHDQLRTPLYSMGLSQRYHDRYGANREYDSIRDSRLRPETGIGLPMRKISSMKEDHHPFIAF